MQTEVLGAEWINDNVNNEKGEGKVYKVYERKCVDTPSTLGLGISSEYKNILSYWVII
jgi:hypothetical protein